MSYFISSAFSYIGERNWCFKRKFSIEESENNPIHYNLQINGTAVFHFNKNLKIIIIITSLYIFKITCFF